MDRKWPGLRLPGALSKKVKNSILVILRFDLKIIFGIIDKATMSDKKRIVKDHAKLPQEVLDQLMEKFPLGFTKHLINIKNAKGERISVLPFETDEIYYLIRMTAGEAVEIFNDYDFDDEDEAEDEGLDSEEIDAGDIDDLKSIED
mgnify:CR=1 FL=1